MGLGPQNGKPMTDPEYFEETALSEADALDAADCYLVEREGETLSVRLYHDLDNSEVRLVPMHLVMDLIGAHLARGVPVTLGASHE